MAEKWVLKTYDGEVYNLNTNSTPGDVGFDSRFNLLIGTMGHYGVPITIQSDVVPNTAGTEFRQVLRGDRTVYLPLAIIGTNAADFHRTIAKFRKSLDPDYECQLWITNEEGETRVLYARYLKGFESTIDDEKRGPNWIKMPLYLIAEDPWFYDTPGSEINQTIVTNPFSPMFLTPTVTITNLANDVTAGDTVLDVNNSAGFLTDQTIQIIGGGHSETAIISSIAAGTITLDSGTINSYAVADNSYVTLIDSTEIFLTTTTGMAVTRGFVNDGCNYVIFWMRGCPPCYAALTQLSNIQVQFPNTIVTKVEVQDADASVDGIGMTAAKSLYPDAYAFAVSCGPTPPAQYEIIDGIMPPVIALYREGIFIQAWCGVHTTGVDPVSNNVILDCCGPRINWRVSSRYLGDNIIIDNTGDDIAYPVWTITGPGSEVHLTNVTTGDDFLLHHTLVLGETVVVDTREGAHTCGSTSKANYTGAGYWSSEVCPTCLGAGVIACVVTLGITYIPATPENPQCPLCPTGYAVSPYGTSSTCENGWQICPTCNGVGYISIWVPSSTGSPASGLYNLRPQLDSNSRVFWGFAPGTNVISVEVSGADLSNTSVQLSLVRRYEGV